MSALAPKISAALPAAKLSAAWDQITGMAGGAYKSVQDAKVIEAQGLHVARLTCDFGASTVPATIGFDADGKVASLWFGPPQPKTPWTPPDYAHPDSFAEQPVTVGDDPTKLTGTLTLPKGKGPFAAVVLVQGSGATDQDEAVGPNKPFKDLAWGLATNGIAVLRYNKRTFQYPASFKGQFTVEQESIEDARAGVAPARRAPGDRSEAHLRGRATVWARCWRRASPRKIRKWRASSSWPATRVRSKI